MTKRMTERAQALGVEFLFETPGKELITNNEGAVVGVRAVDKDGEEIEIASKAVSYRRYRRLWCQRQDDQGPYRLRLGQELLLLRRARY